MVESTPFADARVHALPLSVTEIERVAAPPPDVFVREYLHPRRPVVLTGLTADWLPAAAWTFGHMADRFGDAAVTAARLENRTLFDDPREGVVFRKVVLRDFVASLRDGSPASDYVMAPLGNFPASLHDDFRMPEYCTGAASLQVKVWLGQAGTVTPLHRDVPHNLNVHLTGRKRWLLFPPGASRPYSAAAEATFTIRASSPRSAAWRSSGRRSRVRRKVPRKFTPMVISKPSAVKSLLSQKTPALLTRRFTRMPAAASPAAKSLTDPSDERSSG